jgi:hypothetical protein
MLVGQLCYTHCVNLSQWEGHGVSFLVLRADPVS